MKKIKTAVLISGRGSNMMALFEACKNPEFPAQIALILANKENAAGLDFARQNGIATKFIDHKKFKSRAEFDAEITKEIENHDCQIVCLAGFMRLLSAEFCHRWHNRAINIHPSLLPEFKGADAVGDALKAGAKISGCTVHFVRHEMDEGPILEQAQVEVLPNDDKESLAARILQQEHRIFPRALRKVCEMVMREEI